MSTRSISNLQERRRAAGFKNQADFARMLGLSHQRIGQFERGEGVPDEIVERIEAGLSGERPRVMLPEMSLICPCPASLTDLPNPLRRHVEIAIRSVRILAEESRCGSGYAEKKLGELADALQKAAGHAGRLDEK